MSWGKATTVYRVNSDRRVVMGFSVHAIFKTPSFSRESVSVEGVEDRQVLEMVCVDRLL
jgi:hypothetical protein